MFGLIKKIVALVIFAPSLAFGANYYIRADGTAADHTAATGACGTQANCMSYAVYVANAASYAPGDNFYRCGDGGTYYGQFNAVASGSSGNPISYYDTNSPVSTSRSLISGAWTGPDGNGNYSQNVGMTVFAFYEGASGETWGTEVTKDTDTPTDPADGKWGYSSNTIYYDPSTAQSAPGDAGAFFEFASGSSDAFSTQDFDYLDFYSLHGTRSLYHGFKVTSGSTNINIYNSLFDYNGNSTTTGTYGIGNGIEIAGSNCTVTNSTASDNYDNGIVVELQSGTPKPSSVVVTGCTMEYNYDSGGSVTGEAVESGDSQGDFVGCTIRYNGSNTTYDGSGTKLTGYSSNGLKHQYGFGTIERCLIYSNYGAGIHLIATYGLNKTTTIQNNIIYNNHTYSSVTAAKQDAGITIDDNWYGLANIYNNTLYNDDSQSIGIRYGAVGTGLYGAQLTVKNNIFAGHSLYHIEWEDTTPQTGNPHVFGNNIFDTFATSNYYGASAYATLAGWNALSVVGTDLEVDPLFYAVGGYEFRLTSASTAINAGDASGTPTVDYANYTRIGNPDIGAYEFPSGVSNTKGVTVGAVGGMSVVFASGGATIKR